MSRRQPTENRTEQNRNTLKQLVKLEANKSCSDCKRNKHPRWASWNLGVFICIRCSGIHRGMGTHISRVKSVDLDSWTDEQLQSMLRWGNARANKYWEAKLAPGHVPAEAKIENFIRTKYESKRWVMDGPMPDPSTLDADGDDDVPLNVVQEKAKLERSTSQKAAAATASRSTQPAATRQAPAIDLFGDDPVSAPARPSTGPPISKAPPPPKAEVSKQTKPADSLLGLDFFGGPQAAPPARPSSNPTASSSTTPSRPDLKQSILSLYASKPAAPVQPQHTPSGSFSGMQSPPAQSAPAQSAFGGMNDAFAGLSFTSPNTQQPPKPSPFANLASSMTSSKATPAAPKTTMTSFGGGGGFFDTPTSLPPQAKPAAQLSASAKRSSGGFNDFMSSSSPPTMAPIAAPSRSNDLFDLMGGSPQPTSAAASKPAATTSSYNNSAFNLSKSAQPMQPAAPVQSAAKSPGFSMSSNFDPWGSSDAWNDSKPSATTTTTTTASSSGGFEWGGNASASAGFGQTKATPPQVRQDEDFGGWSSAAPVSADTSNSNSKPAGGFGGNSDDLFSNVWQ